MNLVAHLGGSGGGKLRFDAQADLTGADLRPGESLNKPPGEPLKIAFSGTKTGTGKGKSPTKIQFSDLNAQIRDSAVNGNGWVELATAGHPPTKTFELALTSPQLDLDKLLLPSSADKPPIDPALFAGVRGHALVKVGSLRKSHIELKNVVAEANLVEDELSFKTLSTEVWGGSATANGTKLRLAHPEAPFTVVAHFKDVDVGRGQQLFSDRRLLAGNFNGDVNLSGVATTEELLRTLSGNLQGKLADGQFLGKDLIAAVSAPLVRALPFSVPVPKEGGVTRLGKELGLALGFENGFAKLKSPLQIDNPQAKMTLNGGFRVNGMLDLAGTAALSPDLIASLTQGKARPSEPIPIGFKLTGPAWNPMVSEVDLKGAVESIVKQAAAGAVGGLLGKVGAGALGQRAASEEQSVKAKAQQQQKQAEDGASKTTDKARQQVEDEAAKRLKGLLGR
jgi:AsmA protein